MKEQKSVSIDFRLSNRFSAVDHSIFYLLGEGFKTLESISNFLYIFSEKVISSSLEKMVNEQILTIDLTSGIIDYSSGIKTLIAIGEKKLEINITLPEDIIVEKAYILSERGIVNSILQEIDESQEFRYLANSIELLIQEKHSKEG